MHARCIIINACKDCDHAQYDSGGWYYCRAAGQQQFAERGRPYTPPDWCPLPVYPTQPPQAAPVVQPGKVTPEMIHAARHTLRAQHNVVPSYHATYAALRAALAALPAGEPAAATAPAVRAEPTDEEIGHVTIEQARTALDSMDDFARMRTSVDAMGPRRALEVFIAQVERSAPQEAPAAPAVQAEPVVEYLFIQMDDDGRAWHRWCADAAEVREAVKAAMFFVAVGDELSAEHIDQLDASVDVLLEDGRLTFEGDPPLYLFRMGSAAWEKAAAPTAQPAAQAPAVQPLYRVTVSGRLHETEPLAAAFGLPDGEHVLYAATTQEAPAAPDLERLAREHGTGGWQTLDDMVRFGRAVLAAAGITAPTATTGGEG